jgi:alkanesulfonate monooxygenase SsuD/methylene tetrahydromethanopterin reductase-like flavin-dependent oxidoreductase (luciferase family)
MTMKRAHLDVPVALVQRAEELGYDSVWSAETYSGRTRRMRFGMNVVSLTFRDPVLLAKQCATIDVLSDGRLLPAFGIGSPLAPEWEALGMDTKTRGRKTDECLEIIRCLWREESVDFSGAFLQTEGRYHRAEARSARPADMDRWLD